MHILVIRVERDIQVTDIRRMNKEIIGQQLELIALDIQDLQLMKLIDGIGELLHMIVIDVYFLDGVLGIRQGINRREGGDVIAG